LISKCVRKRLVRLISYPGWDWRSKKGTFQVIVSNFFDRGCNKTV